MKKKGFRSKKGKKRKSDLNVILEFDSDSPDCERLTKAFRVLLKKKKKGS